MNEEELNETIVELQHLIRDLRHDLGNAKANARNWKELYEREKAKEK